MNKILRCLLITALVGIILLQTGLQNVTGQTQEETIYLPGISKGGGASPTPSPSSTPVPTPTHGILLTVDPNQPIHPFSNEMLGVALVNWEHSWGKYFPAQVPHLADVFKSARVGVIRYAGGLWANWVGWERRPQRTPYTDWHPNPSNYSTQFGSLVNTNLTYSFHYGQDEIDNLALFSQQTGAEIMIQVNISKNDPYMWADLLRYANVEHDYGFKYWELGNEIDLETAQGSEAGMSAATYQQRVTQYAAVLRSVDPTIEIVGGVSASAHDIVASGWAWGEADMSRYLYAAVTAGADALSYHWYQTCNSYDDTDAITVWEWDLAAGDDGIADPYENWRHSYSRIWSQIAPERVQNEVIPAGSSMPQGITELNIDSCDFGVAPQNSNHLNAVWMSDVLGRLAYNGLDFATWYTGYGNQGQGYPMVFSTQDFYPTTVYLRPAYYTFFLYANYFGDQLVASTSSQGDDISIWASTDSTDPGTLKLIITNISGSAISATINLGSFSPTSASKFVLSNPDPLDMTDGSNSQNHGTTINGVTLQAASITNAVNQIQGTPAAVQGNSLTNIFAPYSVTAIVLQSGN